MEVTNQSYTEEQQEILLDAAVNCPVAKSLNSEIVQNLELHFAD